MLYSGNLDYFSNSAIAVPVLRVKDREDIGSPQWFIIFLPDNSFLMTQWRGKITRAQLKKRTGYLPVFISQYIIFFFLEVSVLKNLLSFYLSFLQCLSIFLCACNDLLYLWIEDLTFRQISGKIANYTKWTNVVYCQQLIYVNTEHIQYMSVTPHRTHTVHVSDPFCWLAGAFRKLTGPPSLASRLT